MIILEEQNDRDSVWTPTRADFRRPVFGGHPCGGYFATTKHIRA